MPNEDDWRGMEGRRKPTASEWAAAKARFTPGTIVTGRVISHHPFGYFVDLGQPIIGLVEIPRVKELGETVDIDDYPAVGVEISASVLAAVDLQQQIHLSTRPSDMRAN